MPNLKRPSSDSITHLRAGFSDKVRQLLGSTKVFALVGKSGTGKSFRAKIVAENYSIEYIVDDGLLIHNNSIIAGKSAKREQQYMSAVRTALFDDALHRDSVIKAIKSRKIKKILILGTSERMIARTARRLHLSPPSKTILIEEISSEEDIKKAQKSRNEYGRHVIPVPAVEVERDYPKLLSKSIRVLFRIGQVFNGKKNKKHQVFEKSVVQPMFHNKPRGRVAISSTALGQMIAHCVDEFGFASVVHKVKIRITNGTYYIRAEIEIPFGKDKPQDMHELQKYTVESIEKFISIIIARLDLVVTKVAKRPYNSISDSHDTPVIDKL